MGLLADSAVSLERDSKVINVWANLSALATNIFICDAARAVVHRAPILANFRVNLSPGVCMASCAISVGL